MALLRLVVMVVACLALTEALPRYILVPLEDITLVDPNTQATHARHARSLRHLPYANARADHSLQYAEPLPLNTARPGVREDRDTDPLLTEASDPYHAHAGGYGQNDHVDYGAYTGGYGAFGWYSDHPVCINCGHYH